MVMMVMMMLAHRSELKGKYFQQQAVPPLYRLSGYFGRIQARVQERRRPSVRIEAS
jgi:hypothetical protein